MAQKKQPRTVKESSTSPTEIFRGRPEVILEFIFDKGLFFICVRNIGTRPALKISIKFNRHIKGLGGHKDVSELPLFKNIEFLGPQREIVTFVDTSSSYFKRKEPTKISARIIYSDPEQNKYEATINHDLEIYRELAFVDQSTNDDNLHCLS